MRALVDIAKEAYRNPPDGSSIFMICALQELADDGRFDDMTLLLNPWLAQNRAKTGHIIGSLPGIISNHYLIKTPGVSPKKLEKFWGINTDRVESIKSAALSDGRLSMVMASLVFALSKFSDESL